MPLPVYPCTYRERLVKFISCSTLIGISLYLQGTHALTVEWSIGGRYIPVPTGNALFLRCSFSTHSVYPCTYRERADRDGGSASYSGISLYLQGTQNYIVQNKNTVRYIPVPTGNADIVPIPAGEKPVYPCTYRERLNELKRLEKLGGISLYLQGTHALPAIKELNERYIPVPTGNAFIIIPMTITITVYPCTYRERPANDKIIIAMRGISLYLQGTHVLGIHFFA